ncbi:MAG: hypothetical protein ACRCVJ_11780 [Clostridium sp.]|uniref:hypothetical protein n=1 Tax=Clostridium sp. TaxID=1506 RepID=UPI003F321C81
MMDYKEKLKETRNTGKGIALKFKENETYINAISGWDCPHCGAYMGDHPDYYDTNKGKVLIVDTYEIPNDIKYMCEKIGYSWTEDCKCGNCGKLYSQNNGC